jgi:hypothetical protein
MNRSRPDDDDGIIPLPVPPDPESEGCGIRGCLIAVVVLFSILMLLLVFGLLTRIWITPAPSIR